MRGECCSVFPTAGVDGNTTNFLSAFWNKDIKYYYEEDFNDAVNDYINYVSYFMEAPFDASFGNQVCGFNLESSNNYYAYNHGPFNYRGVETDNANQGGYITPNQDLNNADHVVSYRLEIEDIVESYDIATLIQSGSGIDFSSQFEGFEMDEQGNINEPWSDKWNALVQEGWPVDGTTNPNYGRVVFRTPTIDALSKGSRMIEDGFVYRYDYPSVFLVTVFATDSYGFEGKTQTLVDARDLVYIKQTLLNQYSPWQGMNITGIENVQNSLGDIENRDVDDRKSLGLFYYDEINPIDDWTMKYGQAYRGMEGNWVTSYPIDYYYGEPYNKIQFSENFDNQYIRADIEAGFDATNQQIYSEVLKRAFPNHGGLISSATSIVGDIPEEIDEEINTVASQIREELGNSAIAIFNAWALGKIFKEALPLGVQQIVDKIQELMSEPLKVTHTVVKALEEESSVVSSTFDDSGNASEFKTLCIAVNQYESATLDCGEGQSIKRVIFDSYGLPVGECGVYSINPEAHCTPNTVDWINKRTVTVSAENSLCGNTAPDITKYRYVEVQCGYDRYNKWYKGGRFIENADYASTSDGVLAYDKMATAPNKTILETDKEDKAYLVYQKDALSDYYGKYYCNIDYEDDFFNQSSYYKLPNEFKDITTDGQEDLQDIDKDYNIYWLTDSIGECEEMCHWRDYTPENNTCTYTDSWPLNQVKVPVNIRTCSDSYGNNPCGACGADFQIGACLQYDWNGYHNYHYYGYSWGCTQAQCGDYGFRYRCEGSGVDFNGTTQTEAQNFCIDNCYTPKAYNGGAPGDDCVQIDALNASLLKDGNIIKPYQYYLGQNNLVETVDRQRIDRIFSVYMRPYYNEDKNGIGGNTAIPSSHAYEPTKSTIVFRAVADYLPGSDEDINGVYGNVGYGSHIEPVELLNGPFYYGYSNKMDINWNEIYDGTSIWYNPETTLGGSHPEYPDVPMWGIEEINIDPNDSYTDEPNRGLWYKFWVRVLHDENISEYKTEIYPGGLEGEHEASVFLWGTMVQEINPYDEIQMAYQPTRFPGEIGLYDFLPDVDVRTINSADGFKSRLFEYYDDELQPGKYIETTAPLTAQLYFYPRNANDKNLFQPKSIVEYPQQSLYVGFVDWGDGSKPEYDQEPYEVKESNVLKHTYEKSGVYEIKGEIFNIARDTNGIVLGVGRFYTFILRINVNINKEIEGEFQLLGGEKYTFIPYQNTFPVISGTSNKSIYKKIIQRTLGYMDENDPTKKIDVPFKYHGDEMRTELALNTLDDRFVGPTISAYTGSYPSQSGLLDSDTIEIYGGSDACEESASMFVCTSTQEVFDDAYVCGQNCHDYEIAKDGPKGFYEGNVDTITGQLVAEGSTYTDVDGATQTSTIIPKLINKGVDLYGGELGDFLGDIDIAQLRYFEKPVDMWEMLGFPCLNTLESSIINYLPFSIRDNWTHTNMQVLHHSLMMNGYDTFFDSSNKLVTQNNEGSSVEYVVEFPTGIGYEGIKGKSFVFSFFARVWTGYPTIPVNIKMGTYISDEWIMSNQIVDATDEWQRFSIQVDFEDYVDFDPTQLKVEIELTPNTGVETLYVLAPQLQRNELTDYRLPNSPVLSGTCTEAPGGNPGNERYFKNIIPKDKPIYERTGITHISESGWSIDVDDNQQWDEINEYGNNLYYPVLPKLDKLGNTTSILQSNSEGTPNIPFGSIGRNWNIDDINSPITSETIHHLPLVKDCLIDIDFSSESNQALEDLSGNTNLAIFIGDYRVSFNTLMVPKKASSFRTMILGSREKQKGY